MKAAGNRHKGIAEAFVRLLLENGANINAQNRYREIALMKTVAEFLTGRKKVECEPVIRLLLEKGADIEAIDLDGRTPLITAAEHGEETLVRLLLKNGASIEA